MSASNRLIDLSRRRVLRGMLGGATVSLGLPLLDCFLNGNGTAMASGAPLPVRFGIWPAKIAAGSSMSRMTSRRRHRMLSLMQLT